MHRPVARLILLCLALVVAGCGGDDDSDGAARTQTSTDELRPRTAPNPKEVAGARQERADEKLKQREEKELEQGDEEFDKAFEETPFDRLVGRLPIRRPPLHVQQYISGDGHKLYAAVIRKRFCALSPTRRERAVSAFFRSADGTFRRGGVDDLELVVTPVSETLDRLPALATASGKSVTLTSRGRDC